MLKKKTKPPIFHQTEKSFYYNTKNLAFPRFATVYQLDLPKTRLKFDPKTLTLVPRRDEAEHSYTIQYDALYQLYYESEPRLLGRNELFLYNYLKSLANRGLMLRLVEFAEFVEMKPNNLVRHLDRLEDALLIHRVNRQDLHGKPNDIIVHQQATYEQWASGLREKVIERVDLEVTRLSRKEISIFKEDEKGKTRQYVPRVNGRFHFNYKDTIKNTFDDEVDSENFAKTILRYFYDAKAEIVKDVKSFDNDLRKMVKDSFSQRDLQAEEKHYRAALTMRKIYAPVLGEF